MKINSMKIGMLVVAGMMPLAQNSFAGSDMQETRAYVGANYGGFKSRGDEFDDDNDFVEGVVGALITPYFGVEGSYSYFGEFGGDIASATLDGYGLAALLRWPISDTFGIYAKGGYFWWNADIEVGNADGDVDGEEPFYGVGVDFKLGDNFSLAVEYDRYKFDLSDSSLPDFIDDYETDIDTVKVGAKFLF